MKRMKFYNTSEGIHNSTGEIKEEILQEVISVAYGDTGFFQKREIERLAAKYPEIKAVLEEYRETAESVHKLNVDNCPEEIIQIAKIRTGNDKKEEKTFFADLYSVFFSHPVVSFGATAILLVVLTTSVFIKRQPIEPNFSNAEVELANQQAKEAFLIISNIFNKTKNTIESEILAKRVGKPINKSVEKINDLFSQGGQDEKVN